MEAPTYEQWWPLHRRSAVGEALTPQEQQLYEAGLRQFDREEATLGQDASRRTRLALDTLNALRAERARLVAEWQRLDADISQLEAAMEAKMRRMLGDES